MRSLEEGRLLPQSMSQGMNLLSPCHPRFSAYCRDIRKEMGDDYAPYTAVLGSQRRNPKLIWHHLVAVRQSCPASLRHMLPCSEEASSVSVKFSNLLGTGQIGQHLQERMELKSSKLECPAATA